MRTKSLGFIVGMLSLGAGVSVHAAPIVLTPTLNYRANTTWQDIQGTSYTFADANANNVVDVGETVRFTVEMHKTAWGVHDYDALKVWINPATPAGPAIYTNSFIWDFDPDDSNMSRDRWWNPATRRWEDVSYRPWTGGNRAFSFDFTFASVGAYDLIASVMCSADLSGLVGSANGSPTAADWNAWSQTVHGPGRSAVYQGETEKYRLEVYDSVPEPSSLALFLLSLTGLAGIRYFRRRK